MEGEFRRSLMMSLGDPAIFLTRPIAGALIVLTAAVLFKPLAARAWRAATGGRGQHRVMIGKD
jgi:TctA family transporter